MSLDSYLQSPVKSYEYFETSDVPVYSFWNLARTARSEVCYKTVWQIHVEAEPELI